MKFERSDVKFPLWRKKVDSSLFSKAHTPIPNWCTKAWDIESIFGKNTSRKTPNSSVKIRFEKQIYTGWVTYSFSKDTNYQMFFSKELVEMLKDCFIMSYMRSLEQLLRKELLKKGDEKYKNIDIEDELPFWEFVDIEFDSAKREFIFKAHYFQKSLFPELFKQFTKSHHLKEIENQLLEKGNFKFIKEDWKPRSEIKSFLERKNIIYYLLDSKQKLLYIGESENTKRIIQPRKEIPEWDYFRIDCLPGWMSKTHRLELERLIIRSFASILNNSRNIRTMKLSDFRLANIKIDT